MACFFDEWEIKANGASASRAPAGVQASGESSGDVGLGEGAGEGIRVLDGGELKSRRHLNVRGKSATLPSITEKDWDDIKFGVENKIDYYAVSFVKDAKVVNELKGYLQSCGADIHVIVKIESADSIPNLHSIITASDGAMVARGDLGAELPIEEVPLLQEKINMCRSMGKAVIVATNMLECIIVHPTPTRAEVSDIAIAVCEGVGCDLSGGWNYCKNSYRRQHKHNKGNCSGMWHSYGWR